jgi:hypothetical protein
MRCSRAIPAIAAPAVGFHSGQARSARRMTAAVALTGVVVVSAGCSSGSVGNGPHGPVAAPSASQLPPPRATCGTSHTAVDVPVIVEVEKGATSCPEAMRIQSSYTGLVKSGRVGGNGGGAPVKVDGWTCQGADTTTTVQTGEASECHKGATEIVAVLKLQSSGS